MVERSQKEVWRLAPWLVIFFLRGYFVLMAFDAREITSQQRIIRVWSQTVADFVQSFNEGLTWFTPGGDWTRSIVFGILIAVLVFRPQGLLGEQTPEGA